MHPTHLVSLFALLLIAQGLRVRRDRRLHARWMLSAFAVDMALVLYIELSRGAVEQALDPRISGILQIHIAFSTLAAIGWFCLVILGVLMLRGRRHLRPWHLRIAALFLLARLGNFITSFMIQ